jgi:hypothetical protein
MTNRASRAFIAHTLFPTREVAIRGQYRARGGSMEPFLQPFLQKENMLLQLRVQLAASFNTPTCDGKITMSSKAS